MSLVGNLEDLGLGDILQIVSLSRKSGVLSLVSRNREGKVVFRDGQVIRATSSVFRENLGDLLVREAVVDLQTLKKGLLIQKKQDPPPRIGTILCEHFGISKQTIEEVVKRQVEKIVYSFFAWTEGTFSFVLGESSEAAATSFDPLQFMLDQGLNPQWLAMEGSRLLDEKRHRGEALEEEAPEPVVDLEDLLGGGEVASAAVSQELPAAAVAAGRSLFLVDDDPATAEGIGRALEGRGCVTRSFVAGAEFLAAVEEAVDGGQSPVLLIDLIMPRLNGTGILGGIELVEAVRTRFPQLPVFMMSEHANEEVEEKVRPFGVPAILPKPKKADVRDERGIKALQLFADGLLTRLEEAPQAGSASGVATGVATYNWGAELLREMGEENTAERHVKGPESPGLHLLKGMLQELNNPSLGGGTILLVLRFASELMNRAVIFLVKDQEIVGLGQFGIELSGESPDVRIRRMTIPRREGSVFSTVLEEGIPMKVRLGEGRWDAYLREQLGGGQSEEIFLGPIVSEGQVVAVLYGDNLPEKEPIGDTESLEIFLSQAGMAMEKALLERRLRGRTAV